MTRSQLIEKISELIQDNDIDAEMAIETAISQELYELIKAGAIEPNHLDGVEWVAETLAAHNLDYNADYRN